MPDETKPTEQLPAGTEKQHESAPSQDWRNDDPVFKSMLAGLGQAVGKPPEPAPSEIKDSIGRTFAEIAASAAEDRESASAAGDAGGTPPPEEGGEKPAAQPPAPPAPPAAPPQEPEKAASPPPLPPTKPIEVERRQPVEKAVKQAVSEALKEIKASESKTEKDKPTIDPVEASLDPEEKEELEFARYAAEKDPRFKEAPVKFLEYIRRVRSYVDNAIKENPSRKFDETDEDFIKFSRANRPSIDPLARRRLEGQRMRDEISADLKAQNEKELEALRQKTRALEATPQIERGAQEFSTEVTNLFSNDEQSMAAPIVNRAKEIGWDKAAEEDPFFGPVVKGYHEKATALAAEYLALTSGVKTFDPNNHDHSWIVNFIEDRSVAFANNGGDARIRNGRSFVGVGEYHQLSASERAKHWTFGTRDILEHLAHNTKGVVESELKLQHEKLVKSGFERKKTQSSSSPGADTKTRLAHVENAASKDGKQESAQQAAKVSPKATPSAAPGAAQTTPQQRASAFEPVFLNALNIPAPR